jgi:uncharacterized protein YjbI with pentapeptide repeats
MTDNIEIKRWIKRWGDTAAVIYDGPLVPANLFGANLSRADLSRAYLSRTLIYQAPIPRAPISRGADLTRARAAIAKARGETP